MKSTFQKDVYCDKQADGSFLIRFMASKLSAHKASGVNRTLGQTIAILLIIIGLPLLLAHGFGIIFIAAGSFMLYMWNKYADKPASLTVIPNDGIQWSGNQLPFVDIKQIGVTRLSSNVGKFDRSGSSVWETGYVYATSGGREIQLTMHMPVARAEAVRDAILNCSGVTWN